MMTQNARDLKRYAKTLREPRFRYRKIGNIGNGPTAVKYPRNLFATMAVTTDDTRRLRGEREVDLADFSDAFPQGTLVTLSVRGTRGCYIVEVERNGERFIIEGAGATGELTGVLGERESGLTRVPDWLAAVCYRETPLNEVSLYSR